MLRHLLVFFAFTTVALAGCTTTPPGTAIDVSHCQDATLPVPSSPVAEIVTSFGTIEAKLFAEMTPVTVANFVCLAEAGHFDGQRFHRIIEDFMMQGGDPNSKDDDKGDDGLGGPGYAIPDEFHHQLRHTKKGLLSMANSGPDTGGSQFFVTFGPTPHLDDGHTVFGEVVAGMDVVDRVNAEAAGGNDGIPKQEVRLQTVNIRMEAAPPEVPGVSLWSPDPHHRLPMDGGKTNFIVVVQNDGNRRATFDITVTAENGTASVEPGFASKEIAAGQRLAVIVSLTTEGDPASAHLVASYGQTNAGLTLKAVGDAKVGPDTVVRGDTVEVNYIGMTVDGRIFDTSIEGIARYARDNGLGYAKTFQYRGASAYSPFTFQPGGGVIQGFTTLALDTPEGGQDSARIPAAQAYGNMDHPLRARTLIFQMDIVSIG